MRVLIVIAFLAIVCSGCGTRHVDVDTSVSVPTEVRMVEALPEKLVEGGCLTVYLGVSAEKSMRRKITLSPLLMGDFTGSPQISSDGRILTVGSAKFFLNDSGIIVRK